MRLPARDPAGLAYLEALQKDAALGFNVDLSPPTEATFRALAEDLLARGAQPPDSDPERLAAALRQSFEVSDRARWSAHERPDHRFRLWRAELAVVRGMELLGRPIPTPMPAIGTCPTWRLNARAIPVPGTDGYVIAFDTGLFSFTAGWADVLAACLTGVENGGLPDRFVDLCFCQVILGTATYLDWRPMVNPTLSAVGEVLDPVFEAFLLGHEYAHVTLGHAPVDMSEQSSSAEVRGFTHREELDADALGFQLVLAATGDPVHAYVSVAGFLSALHLVERGIGLLTGDARALPPGDTHPPAATRRAYLLQLASHLISREALAQAASMVGLIEDRTIQMWQPLERGFWHGKEGMPAGWAPATPLDKSAALMAFKWHCLGPPASFR